MNHVFSRYPFPFHPCCVTRYLPGDIPRARNRTSNRISHSRVRRFVKYLPRDNRTYGYQLSHGLRQQPRLVDWTRLTALLFLAYGTDEGRNVWIANDDVEQKRSSLQKRLVNGIVKLSTKRLRFMGPINCNDNDRCFARTWKKEAVERRDRCTKRNRGAKTNGQTERGKRRAFFPQSKVNVDFIHFFRSAVRWTCCIGVSVYARLAFSLPVPW